MKKHSKHMVVVVLSFLFSGIFLAYFIYRISGHWDEVAAAFAQANYLYVIPSVALIGLLYVCRVLRWRLFLSHIRQVSYLSLTSATCIGFMANCVLPVRVGELIRPFILYRREKLKLGHAMGTALGLERVFDVVGLAMLLIATWILLGAGQFSGQPDMLPSKGAIAGQSAEVQSRTTENAAESAEAATPQQVIRDRVWAVWGWGLLLAGMAVMGLIMFAPNPMALDPIRFRMICSKPLKVPPQMNRMLVVSTLTKSCCGCLRPPLGGTLAVVPSMIFKSAC